MPQFLTFTCRIPAQQPSTNELIHRGGTTGFAQVNCNACST